MSFMVFVFLFIIFYLSLTDYKKKKKNLIFNKKIKYKY